MILAGYFEAYGTEYVQGGSYHEARQGSCLVLILPNIDFSEEKCHGKCLKSISESLDFKISGKGGGACPQTPLAACAFSAQNLPPLPCLVLKSGYGPDVYMYVKMLQHSCAGQLPQQVATADSRPRVLSFSVKCFENHSSS